MPLALTQVGTSSGAVSDAADNVHEVFTCSAGNFAVDDLCLSIAHGLNFVDWLPIHDIIPGNGVTFLFHYLTSGEAGAGTVALDHAGGGAIITPGVVLRGANQLPTTVQASGSADSQADGLVTASGVSPRALSLGSHAGLPIFVGGRIVWMVGGFLYHAGTPTIASFATGTDLGQIQASPNSSGGSFGPAAARAAYGLLAADVGSTSPAVGPANASWTGGGSVRAMVGRTQRTLSFVPAVAGRSRYNVV